MGNARFGMQSTLVLNAVPPKTYRPRLPHSAAPMTPTPHPQEPRVKLSEASLGLRSCLCSFAVSGLSFQADTPTSLRKPFFRCRVLSERPTEHSCGQFFPAQAPLPPSQGPALFSCALLHLLQRHGPAPSPDPAPHTARGQCPSLPGACLGSPFILLPSGLWSAVSQRDKVGLLHSGITTRPRTFLDALERTAFQPPRPGNLPY